MAVLGNRAYVAVGSRIDVLSLADPDRPQRLGQTVPLGWAIGDVVAQDGLVYVVAFMMSDPEAPWAVTPLLFIFEVPADGAPREVGRLALNPLGGGNWEPTIATPPLSLAVDGGRAYVLSDAVGSSGAAVIAVIDVSQPASPRHLGLAPVAALSTNRLAAEGGTCTWPVRRASGGCRATARMGCGCWICPTWPTHSGSDWRRYRCRPPTACCWTAPGPGSAPTTAWTSWT